MFKFLLTIILLLLLPNLVQLKTYYYSSESECAVNCGVGFGAQCVLKSASEYSREFECICEHGIDGKNCKICAPGYFGKNCAFQCPFGLWGENCANECNCSQPGSTTFLSCYPENGNCICKPGYLRQNGTASPIWEGKAQDCIFQCETGKWGRECQNNCDCQNDINCHHENGKCLCPPDEWTGTKCEKPCVKGTAKPGCKFPCDCIEGQGLCDELTGLCSCNSGFMGPRCEWPCPNGFWGSGCQQRCPNCRWCNPINGTCEIIPPEILNRYTTKFLIKNGNVSNESVERAVIENGFLDDVGDDEKAK